MNLNLNWGGPAIGGSGGLTYGDSFTTSSTSGTSGPMVGMPAIPDWLKPKGMGEIEGEYKSLPGRFADIINPLVKTAKDTISYQTSMGGQAAGNAAREYAAREGASGGNASAAGVVKAQSLLPIFQANAAVRADAAAKVASVRSDAIKTSANIATQLAQLRQTYTNTLAQYITTTRAQDINQTQFNRNFSASERNDKLKALQMALSLPAPNTAFTVGDNGRLLDEGIPGSYKEFNDWNATNSRARSTLAGLF